MTGEPFAAGFFLTSWLGTCMGFFLTGGPFMGVCLTVRPGVFLAGGIRVLAALACISAKPQSTSM